MLGSKGQIDYPIIPFVVLVFGLILIAPIMLKMMLSVRTSMDNTFGNMSNGQGVQAQVNFDKVINTGINAWDKIIIAAFFLAILLLLISAFLIDSSPFWVILYIFISFMLMLFAPTIVDSLSNIYDSPAFQTEVTMLSFMNAVRLNFGVFLTGMMVLTGIIIYGKIAFFGSSGGKRR